MDDDRQQHDGNAKVELRRQFALLAEQRDRQQDGVDRLQVDRQLRAEGG